MRLKSVTVVTLSTAANLLLTLGNQVVLAYRFGAGTSTDAFLACGAVPFVVLNLAIGDLGYILIPLLLQYTGANEARRAIGSTFTAVLLAATLLTVIGEWQHSTILGLTTASDMPVATFALANSMAPVMWGIIGLTVLSSYLTGLHHYYRFFTAAALTLALPYTGMILGGLFGTHRAGIHAVVWGWFAGTLVRTAMLYLGLGAKRPGLSSLRHRSTTELLRSLSPLGLSLLPFVALPSIDVFWASRLPTGSISYLGYSTRIVIALSSLVVQGLSVVLFPDLSEYARNGHLHALRKASSEAIRFIFALMLPLAALAFLLAAPLLSVILQHGRFTASVSANVLRVLPWYLLGILPMAMMNIISRAYFALRDYRTSALTGLLGLAVYISIAGALIGRYTYVGIGMAYAAFWLFLFLLQAALLGRKVGRLLTTDFLRYTVSLLTCTLLAIEASMALARLLPRDANVLLHSLTLTTSFLVVYLLLSLKLFRIWQYEILVKGLLHRSASHRLLQAETQADFVPASCEPAILAGAQSQETLL